jgi:CRP/FNR family transcriptional regulator, cyclic AMP receptor protein
MKRIDELLAEAPAFAGMNTAHLELIAGCATNEVFEPGDFLTREGEPAQRFYVIRRGEVGIETFVPHRGALTVETVGPGDLLGWSWLVPPYRTALDARARTTTHAISFDAECLRGKSEQDAVLGYELMKRFVPLIIERLQATRIRLLDIYGHVAEVP